MYYDRIDMLFITLFNNNENFAFMLLFFKN